MTDKETHCMTCRRLHSTKWIVGILVLIDLGLALRQGKNIISTDMPSFTHDWMITITCCRAVITWVLFGITVTTLNRMLRCHQTKTSWTPTTKSPGGK
jgi:hypothetical protein